MENAIKQDQKRKPDFPRNFMKWMKRKKRKKLRNAPMDQQVKEQQWNDADRIL